MVPKTFCEHVSHTVIRGSTIATQLYCQNHGQRNDLPIVPRAFSAARFAGMAHTTTVNATTIGFGSTKRHNTPCNVLGGTLRYFWTRLESVGEWWRGRGIEGQGIQRRSVCFRVR